MLLKKNSTFGIDFMTKIQLDFDFVIDRKLNSLINLFKIISSSFFVKCQIYQTLIRIFTRWYVYTTTRMYVNMRPGKLSISVGTICMHFLINYKSGAMLALFSYLSTQQNIISLIWSLHRYGLENSRARDLSTFALSTGRTNVEKYPVLQIYFD